MKKDIQFPKVEGVALAIVEETDNLAQPVWAVYILNLKNTDLENVLVSSKGYGQKDGEKVRTSTLRHYLETVAARSYQKIEPIMEELFGLNNEYWVSFYQQKQIFDKKYVFLAESIAEHNYTNIPLINKRGVLIK